MNRGVVGAVIVLLLLLNLTSLLIAYPETSVVDSGCCAANQTLAKDFSAYYTGAWRLLHDPSQVYARGYVDDGEYLASPQPEQYKDLPSLLLLMLPFLALSYQTGLVAFDVVQFLLLPLMAVLLYELLKGKGQTTFLLVALAVLVLPLPFDAPQWGISASYYWQWAEGQSKVLETFLLLLSFYFGLRGRPRLSGVIFALDAFDPRISVLAFPLFLVYNYKRGTSVAYAAAAFVALNAALFYPPLAGGFFAMLLTSGLSTPPYYYTFIPLFTIVCLTSVEWKEVKALTGGFLRRSGLPSGVDRGVSHD